MKKIICIIITILIIAGIIGGVAAWKNQIWMFAPKETEVIEDAPMIKEAPETEIDISAEEPTEDL